MTRHILPNISPSFPSGPEALWAGGQRGEFLPFIKGGKEGFGLRCLYNYGLINNRIKGPRSKFCLTLCPQPIWSIGHQRIKNRRQINKEGVDFIFQQNRKDPANGRIYC